MSQVNLSLKSSLIKRITSRLPRLIRIFLLACYWSTKAVFEDFQDYSAELIGFIPIHVIRLFLYRSICQVKIGKHSSIHRCCRMYRPTKITIGDNTIINYGVLMDGRMSLTVMNNVSISEGTVILSLEHDIDSPDFALKGDKVQINDYVFIGSYARILPGVTIGKGAVVSAGAVVTHDVEPYTVVGGVPAKFIRERTEQLNYRLIHRKRFG